MNYKDNKLSHTGVVFALLIIMIFGAAGCASRNITVPQSEQGMESASEPKLITGIISTIEDDGAVVVSVNSSRPLTYSSVKQPLPLSVILYFPETALEDSITGAIPENNIIGSVKASELAGAGHTSKIIISLIKDVSYEVTSEDTGLRIVFTKPVEGDSPGVNAVEPVDKVVPEISNIASSAANDIAEAPVVSAGKKPVDKHIVSLLEKGNPPIDPEKAVAGTVNPDIATNIVWVNRIDFSSEDAGKSTIIVGTTRPIKYKIEKAGNKRLNLRLGKTKIPPYHHRPLITTRFASAVDRITPVQTPALKDTSLLSIELRESVPYFVEQTDNLLFIHFEASSIPPRPLKEANLPPWKKVLAQTVADAEADRTQIGGKYSSQVSSAQQRKNRRFEPQASYDKKALEAQMEYNKDGSIRVGRGALAEDYELESQEMKNSGLDAKKDLEMYRSEVVKQYTGEKIALDFYETDIKNVFRILKEISGKNFAIDKDVSGTVSLSFDQPVPWDQVLDLVLKMNQLEKVCKDGLIRIVTSKTLQKEYTEEAALTAAKIKADATKEAEEMSVELRKTVQTRDFRLNYAKAETVQKLLKDEQFYAMLYSNTAILIAKDKSKQLSVALDERNNMLLVTAPPIILERVEDLVRKIDTPVPQVMIAARIVEVTEDFSRALGINWSTQGDLNKAMGGDFLDYNLAFNHAVAGTSAVETTFRRIAGSNLVLNAQLTVEQSIGNAKLISTPKVMTMDNKTSTIKQGKEFPYFERDDTGGSSTKFKDVDLSLEVTPHITPKNRISLELKISKNDIGIDTYGGVPIVTTKEVESTLLVKDGDTIVIGGVMQSTLTESEFGTPWLSKVPILGWFFKSKSNKSTKSELLIFITPTVFRVDELLGT